MAAVPWKEIIKVLPLVATAATTLWKEWKSKPKNEPLNPQADVKEQIAALVEKLNTFEERETSQAELVKQITEQLHGLSIGLLELSAEQAKLQRLSIISLAASVAVIMVSLLVKFA